MAARFQRLTITLPVAVEVASETRSAGWLDSFLADDWVRDLQSRTGLLHGLASVRRTETRSSKPIDLQLVVPLEQRSELAAVLRRAAEEIERE